MRRIITYGTFDLLHIGHLNILERLKALGDHLTVAVSTDEFNVLKGKSSCIPFEDRLRLVGALKCVDDVIPECDWEQKITDIQRLQISAFGIGDDWAGKFDYLNKYCDVHYLERTSGVSSRILKVRIGSNYSGQVNADEIEKSARAHGRIISSS